VSTFDVNLQYLSQFPVFKSINMFKHWI